MLWISTGGCVWLLDWVVAKGKKALVCGMMKVSDIMLDGGQGKYTAACNRWRGRFVDRVQAKLPFRKWKVQGSLHIPCRYSRHLHRREPTIRLCLI